MGSRFQIDEGFQERHRRLSLPRKCALSWSERRQSAGNQIVFLVDSPVTGGCKLLSVRPTVATVQGTPPRILRQFVYTIGEFSRITGLSVKTLRFYHEQGLL